MGEREQCNWCFDHFHSDDAYQVFQLATFEKPMETLYYYTTCCERGTDCSEQVSKLLIPINPWKGWTGHYGDIESWKSTEKFIQEATRRLQQEQQRLKSQEEIIERLNGHDLCYAFEESPDPKFIPGERTR